MPRFSGGKGQPSWGEEVPMARRHYRPARPRRSPRGAEVAVAPPASDGHRQVSLPPTITVKGMAELLGLSPVLVIKELMKNGIMATINQVIDYDTAAVVATDLGFEAQEAPPLAS